MLGVWDRAVSAKPPEGLETKVSPAVLGQVHMINNKDVDNNNSGHQGSVGFPGWQCSMCTVTSDAVRSECYTHTSMWRRHWMRGNENSHGRCLMFLFSWLIVTYILSL